MKIDQLLSIIKRVSKKDENISLSLLEYVLEDNFDENEDITEEVIKKIFSYVEKYYLIYIYPSTYEEALDIIQKYDNSLKKTINLLISNNIAINDLDSIKLADILLRNVIINEIKEFLKKAL